MNKSSIFIVEDELITVESVRASLIRDGYVVTGTAVSGEEALEKIGENPPHLVLVDIKLKGKMDGIELARLIFERYDIPVIYLTAFSDSEIVERAKLTESYGYLIKPIEERGLASNIEIALYKHRSDKRLRESEERYRNLYTKQRKTLEGMIEAMTFMVETRDPFTAGHQRRVSDLAGAIARDMGLSPELTEGTIFAAALHDIGKLAVPAELLSKPARLNEVEFQLIKVHSKAGYDILKNIDFPWPIAEIVYQHHERMNGSGYPRGLAGREILTEARIIAVSDVMEAIASHRPYRPRMEVDVALGELEKFKGELYDAGAVDACIKLFTEKKYQLISG